MIRESVRKQPKTWWGAVYMRARASGDISPRLSRRKAATAAASVLALAVGYHVVFGRNGLIGYEQKRMDTKTLDFEVRSLELENARLKSHVDRLESDPDAIEHQAREELHYTRPGEVIYTMPNLPPKK